MKKLSFIIAVILVLFSVSAVQAKMRKSKAGMPSSNITQPTPLRSANDALVLGTPTIYTDTIYLKPDSLAKLFGAGYFEDNFDNMLFTHDSVYNYIDRTQGDFALKYSTADEFYEMDSALSTIADPIVITNTGVDACSFGGMFYAVSINDVIQSDTIIFSINDGAYIYKYLCTNDSNFIAFKFPNDSTAPIYNVTITPKTSTNYPVANSLFWGNKKVVTALRDAKNEKIRVYPNPTSDGIYINATGTIRIFSTAGNIVLNQETETGSFVSLSDFPRGLYFVQITSNEGVLLEKIIKK